MHIQIGKSYVDLSRVVWVAPFRSRPIMRMIHQKKDRVTNITEGKRPLSVIFTDTDHILLTSLPPEDIINLKNVADPL